MKHLRCAVLLLLAGTFGHWSAVQAGAASPANPFFAMSTGTKDAQHSTFAAQADMLKELGYAGTDLLGTQGIPELAKELDSRNLRFFAIYSGVNIDPGGPQWEPGFEAAIRALNGRETILWIPMTSKKYAVSSPDGDADAVSVLNRIADMAAASKLRIALYPHTGHWLERVEDAVRIANKVDRPNVGVTFNLCHWLRVDGKDLRAHLESALPRLFMVTINGAETGGTDWATLIQTLDRGSFNVKDLLLNLKNLGYTGPVGLQGYGIGGDIHDNLRRSMTAWRALQE
jgi:sugar phosphate isomerase/epimerase